MQEEKEVLYYQHVCAYLNAESNEQWQDFWEYLDEGSNMKKYKGASQRALQEMIGASGEACEVCLPGWRSTQRARLVLVKGSK